MSRTTESLPQAAAPVRAAVRLAIIVSLCLWSGLLAGRALRQPREVCYVGLLAFLRGANEPRQLCSGRARFRGGERCGLDRAAPTERPSVFGRRKGRKTRSPYPSAF